MPFFGESKISEVKFSGVVEISIVVVKGHTKVIAMEKHQHA